MAKKKRKTKGKRKKRWRTRTWVVGRVPLPATIAGVPEEPEIRLVLERPDRLIVGHALDAPGEPGSLADLVAQAIEAPMVGPPRTPDRLVVAQRGELRSLERELEALGLGGIPVTVAPAPDLEKIAALMAADLAGGRPGVEPEDLSYLAGGTRPAQVAELFAAAAALQEGRPWDQFDDGELFRVSCPELFLEDACALFTGHPSEGTAALRVFPSLQAYDAFLEATNAQLSSGERGGGIGSPVLSLELVAASELPPTMRREAATHGWPVTDASAYPMIELRGADGYVRPVRTVDVRALTAAAGALARALDVWADPEAELCQRLTVGDHSVEVERFDDEPSLHEIDRVLCASIVSAAADRFGETLDRAVQRAFPQQADDALWVGVGMLWVAYELELEGKRLVEWFLEDHPELDPAGHAHLRAQRRAWFSAWEVTAVEPGETLTLVDHLTGEERVVRDVEASKSIPVRSSILGRILDHEDQSLLVGVHERYLGPKVAAGAVEAMRAYLRRKSAVPPERLRDPKVSRRLILLWLQAIEADDERRLQVPTLQNTDGDPLLLTEDRFSFEPIARAAIRERIEALEGALDGQEDGEWALSRPGNAMHASWDNTIVAHLELGRGTLHVRTNSVRRADEARATIEAALGALVRHQTRVHDDPTSEPALAAMQARGGKRPPHEADPESTPEMIAALQQFKARHYAGWLDQPVPALGHRTPRQATKTKKGRRQVDLLLREIEHHEQALPPSERFDFAPLRRELGL